MHAAGLRVLRTASRASTRETCRIVAGVRHPHRHFHRSAFLSRNPDNPEAAAEGKREDIERKSNAAVEDRKDHEGDSEILQGEETTNAKLGRVRAGGRLRPGRKQADTPPPLPPVLIPDWFWERHVLLSGTERQRDTVKIGSLDSHDAQDRPAELADASIERYDASNILDGRFGARDGRGEAARMATELEANAESLSDILPFDQSLDPQNTPILSTIQRLEDTAKSIRRLLTGTDLNQTPVNSSPASQEDNKSAETDSLYKYTIDANVFDEVAASVKASLRLRPSKGVSFANVPRPNLVLHCPKDGGTLYLDAVIDTLAEKLQADIIRLDSTAIAQLVGPYLDEDIAWTYSKDALLGYDAQQSAGRLDSPPPELIPSEDESPEDDDNPFSIRLGRLPSPLLDLKNRLSSGSALNRNTGLSKARASKTHRPRILHDIFSLGNNEEKSDDKSPAELLNDLKTTNILEHIVLASDTKRASLIECLGEAAKAEVPDKPRDILIHVQDYKELNSSQSGSDIINKLRTTVNKLWQAGRNISIIGTTSRFESNVTRSWIYETQGDIVDTEHRTIVVTPGKSELHDATVFTSDEKSRILDINIRHVEEMLKSLAGDLPIEVNIRKGLNSSEIVAQLDNSNVHNFVWSYTTVHRLATALLGSDQSDIDASAFVKYTRMIADADEAKLNWAIKDKKALASADSKSELFGTFEAEVTSPASEMNERLKLMKKTCTSHEKRLLGGVIIPSKIKTTFSDVHVPEETIVALKSLTTLSLQRPDAFSYGVLASDKISGALLYGPPGTGKTLLAKAVAKESGATVLEVSGAEIYNKFVGEGEKNVKAIFSLAKKLTPCVVFIDEADALLANRSQADRGRTTHREIMNQFLREWDGMNSQGAFIMVATNRPYDLDEAVLRRLPRRLLVDLPVEKDREAILRIHLKNEVLDDSVSISALAKNTAFYSGSDLKNVAVAAALACVREEQETAIKHTGEEPYVYPPRRTLSKHHFDKGLEEISASISEDMSTLSAIRKFDEMYGDRKGRRKKGAGLGFGGTTVEEIDSAAARVRSIQK